MNIFEAVEKYIQSSLDISKLCRQVSEQENTFEGNCGMFALALREVLGKGEIVLCTNGVHEEYAEDPDAFKNLLNGEPDIWHVALIINNKLYDGSGEIGIDNLEDFCYNNYGDATPYITKWTDDGEKNFEDVLYKIIRNNTKWSTSKEEFIKIINDVLKSD